MFWLVSIALCFEQHLVDFCTKSNIFSSNIIDKVLIQYFDIKINTYQVSGPIVYTLKLIEFICMIAFLTNR